MSTRLVQQTYGKHRVRISKIKRPRVLPPGEERHELVEITVDVELQGCFDTAYTDGDNSLVIATDTCRNTIYVLAKDDPLDSIESFAATVANHFLRQYSHVNRVTASLSERRWHRLLDCPHGFLGTDNETPTSVVTATRDIDFATIVRGGLENLTIAKTTQSGFASFHRDEYRTLPDTDDRILATSMKASWTYNDQVKDYTRCREQIRSALLATFVNHYSRSVQETLYKMAEAALAATESISTITLTMPNKHHIAFNLAPFNRTNDNEIFVVTDEPFGFISATVDRA
jgi:urate oxidase